MRDPGYFGRLLTLSLVLSCGGAEPPPAHSADRAPDGRDPSAGERDASSPGSESSGAPEATPSAEAPAPAATVDTKPADAPAPAFKENGSVKEAIDAVPQGAQRLNIDQEALGRPLGNVELYEPCKPGNQHFKAKIAVWDGKAVGLDLTTTPKNQKFADCIAERIRSITWPDKVKSLNIVEYTF
jgi:hypothetical protein